MALWVAGPPLVALLLFTPTEVHAKPGDSIQPPACPVPLAQAEAARRSVAAAVAASKSDHLAVVAAYNSWRAVLEKVGRGSEGWGMPCLVAYW